MIQASRSLRRVLSQKYPYIFVDEAQDTLPAIVTAFNALCAGAGLPIVGYFGDPMQQIYDRRMGDFAGPPGSKTITKVENFRSATEIVSLLNAFRKDVIQVPAGHTQTGGSVGITLVRAERPDGRRGQYSEEQLQRAHQRFADAIRLWGWTERKDAKLLFLAWRMVRRLGFSALHDLFTGPYASSRAKNAYEEGEHFLLKPLVETIIPLVKAKRQRDTAALMRLLTSKTAAFRPGGEHSSKTIAEVRHIANDVTANLVALFGSGTIGEVFRYCREKGLFYVSDRLSNNLDRLPREEVYDETKHAEEKSDWLADAFFKMRGAEMENYCDYLNENTPYSTQHGVKGEEYDDVIVVFDDTEAAWHNYSFAKMLTPQAAGEPKDTQKERSRKLAYVCFSRAVRNLRVVLFTPDPKMAAQELIAKELFHEPQITLLD